MPRISVSRDHDRIALNRRILAENGCPDPPGAPIDLSYRMGTSDWYCQTRKGWFYLDPHTREWKFLPQGPL